MQDEDGALLPRESPEGTLELVAPGDAHLRVVHRRHVDRDQAKPRLPAPRVPDLGIASADQKSVKPGFQAAVIAQRGQLAPRDQEGLLDRVLRSAGVAQDPIRDGVEPIAELRDERRERFLVAPLRTIHEVWAHRASCTARLLNMSSEGAKMLKISTTGRRGRREWGPGAKGSAIATSTRCHLRCASGGMPSDGRSAAQGVADCRADPRHRVLVHGAGVRRQGRLRDRVKSVAVDD